MQYSLRSILKAILFLSSKEIKLNAITLKGNFLKSRKFAPIIVRLINKFCYHIPLLGFGGFYDRYSNSLSIYSSNQDKTFYNDYSSNSIFVNLGSGGFSHPKWLNYDYPGISSFYKCLQGKKNVDFYALNLEDKKLRLPFKENTVSLIYCSHTLEHLSKESIFIVLNECKRILVKNGILRIVIPNTKDDFERAKIICNQDGLSNIKEDLLKETAKLTYSSINLIEKDEYYNNILKANYSSAKFAKMIEDNPKYKKINEFDKTLPERHISYLDHEILSSLNNKIGFKYYLPLLRNQSLAKPILNDRVFDTTENHYAIYGEFIN